jgi:menaquinone-specific isochorismate synthase
MESTRDSMAWLARRDGCVLVGHGPFEASAKPPTEGVAFYVQDFALKTAQPWKIPSRVERTTTTEFGSRFSHPPSLKCLWQGLDPAPFSVVFQEIMSSIHGGVFEKTVPVVTESGTTEQAPGASIVAAMARQEMPLQSYGWIHPDCGFAGATPELLFSLHGSRLETMALAGTARSEDRDVFAVDEKEIREHEYVAQTLVSKLLDLGQLERRSREILDLGPIVHFLTLIHLNLQTPMNPEDLLHKLHPTPALGPLPRTNGTMDALLEWRNRLGCPPSFGAPFGLWDNGCFESIVAIRGIWWNGNQIHIPTGCGIIEASRLVNEWRELRLKREAVKCLLPRVDSRQSGSLTSQIGPAPSQKPTF